MHTSSLASQSLPQQYVGLFHLLVRDGGAGGGCGGKAYNPTTLKMQRSPFKRGWQMSRNWSNIRSLHKCKYRHLSLFFFNMGLALGFRQMQIQGRDYCQQGRNRKTEGNSWRQNPLWKGGKHNKSLQEENDQFLLEIDVAAAPPKRVNLLWFIAANVLVHR